MNLEVRSLQVSKTSWIHEPLQQWEKKISFYNPCQIKWVKQDRDLVRGLSDRDWLVLVDERGKTPTSRQQAQELERWLESGKQRIVFVVGGPFGFDAEVMSRANAKLSLSHFVMNQEVALIVLLEQIFRGMTIIKNHPYHND